MRDYIMQQMRELMGLMMRMIWNCQGRFDSEDDDWSYKPHSNSSDKDGDVGPVDENEDLGQSEDGDSEDGGGVDMGDKDREEPWDMGDAEAKGYSDLQFLGDRSIDFLNTFLLLSLYIAPRHDYIPFQCCTYLCYIPFNSKAVPIFVAESNFWSIMVAGIYCSTILLDLLHFKFNYCSSFML